jgi:hypothetical protein
MMVILPAFDGLCYIRHMRVSDSPKIEGVPGLVAALRLSTEHLLQLIEMQENENTSALDGPIMRAITAHSSIVASLEQALRGEPSIAVEKPPSPPPLTNQPPAESNWIEAPWKYLNIPSKDRGQLGPMPRFVPVPNGAKKD